MTREAGWGCEGNPISLGEGEYYMLGDNSPSSRDSRAWGTVPEEALVGPARWVYWPPERRRELD